MKKFLIASIAVMVLCLSAGSVFADSVGVVLTKNSLSVNGKGLPAPMTIEDVTPALGKHSRKFELANNLYVYDDSGLVVYQDIQSSRIIQLSAFCAKQDFEYVPTKFYSGRITVEGQAIDCTSSMNDIRKKLPEVYFEKIGGEWFKGMIGKTAIYVTFKDGNLKTIDMAVPTSGYTGQASAVIPKTASTTKGDPSMRVSVTSKAVSVNGTKLPVSPVLADFTKILGSHSRLIEGVNNLYVFDEKGIVLFENPATKKVVQVSMFYANPSYEYVPKALFAGRFMVGDKELSSTATMDANRKRVPELFFEKLFDMKWYAAEIGGFAIYMTYDTDTQVQNIAVSLPEKTSSASSSAAPNISVSSSSIMIKGTKMPIVGYIADYKRVLGEPSKKHELSNNIYVYDDLGIALYENPTSKRIVDIALFYTFPDYVFTPKNLYTGKLDIDGKIVNGEMSIATVKKTVPEQFFEQLFGMNWYKAEMGNVSVYINYLESGKMEKLDLSLPDK